MTKQWQRDYSTVCVPRRGAELFVSAQPAIQSHTGIVHADLNAAANIGLRALMDPDWPGAWWYVPAQLKDGFFVPADDKTSRLPVRFIWGLEVGPTRQEYQQRVEQRVR